MAERQPRQSSGFAYLLLGLGVLAGAIWVIQDKIARGPAMHSVLLIGALLLGAGLLVTLGMRRLRPPRLDAPAEDYRHAVKLFAVTAVALGVVGGALEALVPASYGDLGHFRADAITDARLPEPDHLGEPVCAGCHEEKARLHAKDAHARIPCESCHAPGREHAAWHRAHADAARGASPEIAKMRVRKDDRRWCLRCHAKDPARPGAFPQIDWKEHMLLTGVKDTELTCTTCHDPHEPLFMDRDLRNARMHPLIHRCGDCHTSQMEQDTPLPEEHPATFQCSYCHKEIVDTYQKYSKSMPHQKLECTTCHVFFKESEFSGRIIRDTDRRFCLLCHRKADFREKSRSAPQIDWPQHQVKMRDDADDKRDQCNQCHQWALHWPWTDDQYEPDEPVKEDSDD